MLGSHARVHTHGTTMTKQARQACCSNFKVVELKPDPRKGGSLTSTLSMMIRKASLRCVLSCAQGAGDARQAGRQAVAEAGTLCPDQSASCFLKAGLQLEMSASQKVAHLKAVVGLSKRVDCRASSQVAAMHCSVHGRENVVLWCPQQPTRAQQQSLHVLTSTSFRGS